jgi:hypothetical protein
MDLEKFIQWYESLTIDSLNEIDQYYHNDVFFKDPFNEFQSRETVKEIFKVMFEKLGNPRFIILDKIRQEDQVFVTWDFLFLINEKEYSIHGSSHFKLKEGRVSYHRDYWDVGEEMLEKIPVIRTLYLFLKKKFSHS